MPSLSDTRAIENLIYAYAELVDTGDFAALGEMFAEGAFVAGGERFSGREAVERMFHDVVVVHDDGTPRTQHVTTNVMVEIDERKGTATGRSCVTVLQAVPGELPLQVVAAGRYRDRFERHGERWRFAERRPVIRLTGEVSDHLRQPTPS